MEPLSLGELCADCLKALVSEIWDALLLKAFNDKQCYLSHRSHLWLPFGKKTKICTLIFVVKSVSLTQNSECALLQFPTTVTSYLSAIYVFLSSIHLCGLYDINVKLCILFSELYMYKATLCPPSFCDAESLQTQRKWSSFMDSKIEELWGTN